MFELLFRAFSRKFKCLLCRYSNVFVTQYASRMEKTHVLLKPLNYFEWKTKLVIQMRSKGLYRVTMGTETEFNSTVEKSKYFNRLDEVFGMLCLSIGETLSSM